MATKNNPPKEVRMGSIKATIWKNDTEAGTRHNVTFSRLYRDGANWKSTESFGRDDLLLLAKVADEAHSWICAQQAPSQDSETKESQATVDSEAQGSKRR
jgi:hypothetical protein